MLAVAPTIAQLRGRPVATGTVIRHPIDPLTPPSRDLPRSMLAAGLSACRFFHSRGTAEHETVHGRPPRTRLCRA